MLYFLFDITVNIKKEKNQKTYKCSYLTSYPSSTEPEAMRANAEYLMNSFVDTCSEDFFCEFCCTEATVQTGLDACELTKEQYNHLKEVNGKGE